MNKRDFRSGHQGKLPHSVAQGNQLVMTSSAADQAWVDLENIHRECVAMSAGTGVALTWYRAVETREEDRASQNTRMEAIATHMKNKQVELNNLAVDVKRKSGLKYDNPQDKMVAALDMSMAYNEWIDMFHKTAMVAVDDFLELYRRPPYNHPIPYYSGHYTAFNPAEVEPTPLVGEYIPNTNH